MPTIKVPCYCTKGRHALPGCSLTYEGVILECRPCHGTSLRDEWVPHASHVMSHWRTEIRCPGSTPRFYGVRNCKGCGAEEMKHAAGHFKSVLSGPCPKERIYGEEA